MPLPRGVSLQLRYARRSTGDAMESTASSNSLKLKAPSLPRWYLAERDVCRVVKSASLAGVSSEEGAWLWLLCM